MAVALRQRKQDAFSMEGGVIHHNDCARIERWQQHFLKPRLKKRAVHRAVILHRRNDLAANLRGHDACAFVLLPADRSMNWLAPGGACIGPVEEMIDACFVHISDAVGVYPLNLRQIRRYFFRVLLSIVGCLFLRVICKRFNALRIAASVHENSSAISRR